MQQYKIRSHTKEGIRLVNCSCLLMRHLQRRLWERVMWGEVQGGVYTCVRNITASLYGLI